MATAIEQVVKILAAQRPEMSKPALKAEAEKKLARIIVERFGIILPLDYEDVEEDETEAKATAEPKATATKAKGK